MHDYSVPTIASSYPTYALPTEIVLLIIELASAPKYAGALKPLDATSEFPCVSSKADFEALQGLSCSCSQFYRAVQKHWFRALYVREVADWGIAIQLGICAYVQTFTLLSSTPNEIPAGLVVRNNGGQPQRGYYHRVVSSLPLSLRRLWIVNVHGPDAAVIHTLRAHCPQLEELSISRCTLFSPRLRNTKHEDPGNECKFWALFPDGHDSYFAAEGVESYAKSLSQELEPLSKLKKIHMGVYLTPHEAIKHDRQSHVPVGSNPWSACCTEYRLTYEGETTAAETIAKDIIFRKFLSLEEVSWASFFTDNRIGAALYINSDTPSSAAVGKHFLHIQLGLRKYLRGSMDRSVLNYYGQLSLKQNRICSVALASPTRLRAIVSIKVVCACPFGSRYQALSGKAFELFERLRA
ncbi:hypothetical protein BDV93DRAFT_515018 [Ceratobasidium sp. AG-I]|nr:hypothetical protein BDV93DRAFT_515018 [Ceratobasidium sp. AG-I]